MPAKDRPQRSATAKGIKKNKTTLVVGLDFGTTFSGVAYALSTNPQQISIVSRWKGELYYQTKDKQKVPRVIAYDKSGQPIAWGYEIQYSHTPLKWLKLLLVEEDELPSHLSSSAEYKSLKKQIKALQKSPVTIIGDYLRLLWAHAWSQIKAALGESFFEACKIKIVVTLPGTSVSTMSLIVRKSTDLLDLVSLGDELRLVDWSTGMDTVGVLAEELIDCVAMSSESARGESTPGVSVSAPSIGTLPSCIVPVLWGFVSCLAVSASASTAQTDEVRRLECPSTENAPESSLKLPYPEHWTGDRSRATYD
ncbi:uncharacterized protein J7T54_000404 [Emericellopsis cladophorae]|uniref:Uncharacterized protein n=1 Tax=Emericellopsis cladophorae TaxID=2686198 RepID=A0A9Q0BB94_9HYPO|nr:uncharacterized protein J7T54_000404 [Emericellopsis cladophorae]KAI6777814.1 hypothetical protein J7T54_000404 [Emericellopsis cladophorae]